MYFLVPLARPDVLAITRGKAGLHELIRNTDKTTGQVPQLNPWLPHSERDTESLQTHPRFVRTAPANNVRQAPWSVPGELVDRHTVPFLNRINQSSA